VELPAGVAEALEQAKCWQAESWLNINEEICGVEVTQMTLKQFFLLEGADTPLFKGGKITAEDLAVFLWILSPEWKPCQKARNEFCKKVRTVNIVDACNAAEKYLEATFAEADTGGEEKKKKYANFISYIVDMFGREYGWTIGEIMKLPMRQIYQLSTAIGERYAAEANKQYSKLRQVDMLEAKALLAAARAKKAKE
jgi:hypothetical protein